MGHHLSLEQIKIAEPCHASWDAMSGDATRRFCDSCSKHVHDLSTLSREEAEALVNAGGSVCVRMQIEPGGVVRTKQSLQGPQRRRAPWMRLAASFATLLGVGSLFQFGCERAKPTMGAPVPTPPEQMRTMGMITPQLPTTLPSTLMGDIALPTTQPAAPENRELMGKVAPR